jgi:threonine/homoserine/homoserine lactone efflux protein
MIFLRALIIGLAIAAPVGPIGVLCIRRTLSHGRVVGFVSGLGAATADAFYGSIAGLGLTAVAHLLIGELLWLRLVGGIFLCYLGVVTCMATAAEGVAATKASSLYRAYLSTLGLTLTNPTTILSFVAIFAGLGFGSSVAHSLSAAVPLVLGVFTGSALWWLTLSTVVSRLRAHVTTRGMIGVNRISGMVILIFGAVALGSVVAAMH